MNPDDFESRLVRQPLRAPPDRWREEILRSAEAASGPQPSTFNSQPVPWWRELLWPCPQAWAAIAAVWVVIGALHLMTFSSTEGTVARRDVTPSAAHYASLREQQRLFSELLDAPTHQPPPRPTERSKVTLPRPRSERLKTEAMV